MNAAGDGAWAFGTGTPEVVTVLTGNLGQTIASGFSSVEDVNAQGFTTGADPYVVTGIDTWITQSADSAQRLTVRAELWSAAAGGGPGSKLADLTVPAVVSPGTLRFLAPRDTVLSPGTTYYFVLYTVGAYHIGQSYTAATAEDSIGLPGWSIEDTSWYITPHDVPASHTWFKSGGGEVALIRVNGIALRLGVSADPACGSVVTDPSAQPAWILRRTPAPASEKGVEWRIVDAEGGELFGWRGANTVRPPLGYSVSVPRDNSFAELRAAFPRFAGVEFRLRSEPSARTSCIWRFGGGGGTGGDPPGGNDPDPPPGGGTPPPPPSGGDTPPPPPSGGGGGGGGGGGARNQPPEVTEDIAEQVLDVGADARLDLTDHFRDPERRDMSFAAESADTAVARVTLTGDELALQGVAHGASTVTVTATDHRGLTATQTFTVTVGWTLGFATAQAMAAEGDSATLTIALNRVREVDTTVAYMVGARHGSGDGGRRRGRPRRHRRHADDRRRRA